MAALRLLAIPLFVCSILVYAQSPQKDHQFEGRFEVDRDIPIHLSGASNGCAPVRGCWVRFSNSSARKNTVVCDIVNNSGEVVEIPNANPAPQKGEISASVRVVTTTILNAHWRLRIELLGGAGREVARAEGIFKTTRRLAGVAFEGETDLCLNVADESVLNSAERFRVSIERAADDSKITIAPIDPMMTTCIERLFPQLATCTLKVRVHKPVRYAFNTMTVWLWRAYDENDPALPRSAMYDMEPYYWKEPGSRKIWCTTSFQESKSFRLIPGEYRVSVHPLKSGDPTPFGVSEPIDLTTTGTTATVDVKVERGSQCSIHIKKPSNGGPFEKIPVAIRRGDGFPLYSEQTDAGPRRYRGLPAGDYEVRVGDSGWRDGVRRPNLANVTTATLSVERGKTARLTIQYPEKAAPR